MTAYRKSPNGSGTVYRDERGWCSEAWVDLPDGRRRRLRGRGRTAHAAIAARQRAIDKALGGAPAYDRLTVAQLARQWLDAREGDWKPATLASYRVALDHHILPELGHSLVMSVRSLDAQRVLASVRAKSSSGGHAALANRCRRVMHAMFNQAKRWGIVTHNPISGIEPVRVERREARAWSPNEAERFLLTCGRSPYREFFEAALFTGLRSGELLVLRWRDVEDGSVIVRRTYSQHAPERVVSAPKTTGSRRRVPLPGWLAASLEARRGQPDGLVFASRTGRLLNPTNVRRALIAYSERAEVPIVRFHDLRRTYATVLAMQGNAPSVIQRLLGHATPDLALRVYTAVYETSYKDIVPAFGGYGGGHGDAPARPIATSDAQAGEGDSVPDTLN